MKENKKIPQDIFANAHLEVPFGSLSESIAPQRREASPAPAGDLFENKVRILMIVAIIIILVGAVVGVLILVFRSADFFTSKKNANTELDIGGQLDDADTQFFSSGTGNGMQDSDKDGLSDTREEELGLDPSSVDSDNDELSDKDEIDIYFTDPFDQDTDNDGFLDGAEVKQGFDPNGLGRLNDIFRIQE